jgi:hypothetical protein
MPLLTLEDFSRSKVKRQFLPTARVRCLAEQMRSDVARPMRALGGMKLTAPSAKQHGRERSTTMPDDPTKRGPQDRSRISLTEDYELRYWTQRFGVSREELTKAVQAAGHSVEKVEEYLRRKKERTGAR